VAIVFFSLRQPIRVYELDAQQIVIVDVRSCQALRQRLNRSRCGLNSSGCHKPGTCDQHFGFSRSFYYTAEKRGWLKLIRIRDEGKGKGVTLIRYTDVAAFVREQMKDAR
jgi:hypothetical protein